MRTKLIYLLLFLNTLSFLIVLLAFPSLYIAQLIFSGIVVLLMYLISNDVSCLKLTVVYFSILFLAFITSLNAVQFITALFPVLLPALATFFAVRGVRKKFESP